MADGDVTPVKRDETATSERHERPLGSGKRRQRTLRFRLACLVLACTVPFCVIAGFVVYHAYQQRRTLTEQRVLGTARALSMVLDQEFATMQAGASALATSPALASGDFEAFYKQVKQAQKENPGWGDINLSDASGKQYINSYVPFGTPLPKRHVSDVMRRAFENGEPGITNLFHGALTGRNVFAVEFPVFIGGKVKYDLVFAVPAERLETLFSRQGIPLEWPATILDANQVIVARNGLPEKYVGLPTIPALNEGIAEAVEGRVEAANREGIPMIAMFHRSTKTGWTVAIGIPKAVLMAGTRVWLWWTVGSAVLLSMIGIGLALLLAERIAHSIHALIPPAMALGAGEAVEIGPLDLAETDKVRQSLEEASHLLGQRTAERNVAEGALRESEERLRLLGDNLPESAVYQYIHEADGRVRFLYFSAGVERLNRVSVQAVLRDAGELQRQILPEYFAQLIEAEAQSARDLTDFDMEVPMRRPDGELRWMRLHSRPRQMADGHVLWDGVQTDITERKRAGEERETTIEFLRLVNLSRGSRDLIQRGTSFFQQRSGCEAVGIRLQEGNDYPYFEYRGFSKEFVQSEKLLCVPDESGRVACDSACNPALDCMCGNVIRGRIDPSKPFFTANGSFWTNDTTRLLATTTEADRDARTRNRCNGEGYESVALIALRSGDQRLGLLQLNDRQKGRFSLDNIRHWERLAGYLAAAVSKFRAEEALRVSEERLRQAADLVGLLPYTWEPLSGTLHWDVRLKALWGLPPDAVTNQEVFLAGVHPEDRPYVEKCIGQSLDPAGDGTYEAEYRVIGADGAERWISARGRTIFAEDKPVVHQGVVLDITEHKKAEQRIVQLATYPELNPNPILEVDLQGKITYANQAARMRFPEVEEAGAEHPIFKEWFGMAAEVGADAEQHVLTREVETSGSVFQQTIHYLAEMGVIRVYLIDISMRKQAEGALMRSEKLASAGRMAATIAHEINNPLEAVMNLLYVAKISPDLASAQQYLEMADAELKRIAHITRQSLGFYRESNAPAQVAVSAMLESSVDLLKSKINAKNAVIEKQWDGEVQVMAVAGELRQVFSNLLANSLDAIDQNGTITLRVTTEAARANNHRWVRVTVADNGKGISASSRQHIFEPFFTTKGTVGTGLGLWVSKQIIEKHGGSIRVRSSSNGVRRGTAFSIVLPIEPATAVEGAPETPETSDKSMAKAIM